MNKYTKEEILKMSKKQIDLITTTKLNTNNYCNNCKYCKCCNSCKYCKYCYNCNYCKYCYNCNSCNYCYNCNYCCDCYDCNDCDYCYDCYDCNDCNYCYKCSGLSFKKYHILNIEFTEEEYKNIIGR